MNTFWTIFATIVSGVFVYVVCEYLKVIWLDTYHLYKEIKGEISYSLTFYANRYTSVVIRSRLGEDELREIAAISDEFRMLACKLVQLDETCYRVHPGIPERTILREASKCLIGLSNNLTSCSQDNENRIDRNFEAAQKIRNLLKLVNIKGDNNP